MGKIVATHKTKAAADAEAKRRNKKSRVYRYSVRKSKYTTIIRGRTVSFWNVVQSRK